MKQLLRFVVLLSIPILMLSACTPNGITSSSSSDATSSSVDDFIMDQDFVDSALPKTFVTGLNQVYRDLYLPRYINKDEKVINVSWSVDVTQIVIGPYNDRYLLGDVTRPHVGQSPILYHLTATLEYNGKTANKTYHGYIMPYTY